MCVTWRHHCLRFDPWSFVLVSRLLISSAHPFSPLDQLTGFPGDSNILLLSFIHHAPRWVDLASNLSSVSLPAPLQHSRAHCGGSRHRPLPDLLSAFVTGYLLSILVCFTTCAYGAIRCLRIGFSTQTTLHSVTRWITSYLCLMHAASVDFTRSCWSQFRHRQHHCYNFLIYIIWSWYIFWIWIFIY